MAPKVVIYGHTPNFHQLGCRFVEVLWVELLPPYVNDFNCNLGISVTWGGDSCCHTSLKFGTSPPCLCELGGAMWRFTLCFGLVVHGSGGSWWWNHTQTEEPSVPRWRQWVSERAPWAHETFEGVEARFAQAHDWFSTSSGSDGSDWGVWLIVDSVVGLFGWLIFGSAWDGVKSGVKRLLQLGAVLVACLAAHYAWAIAWPVVSCIIAVVMAIVWAVRLVVKLLG